MSYFLISAITKNVQKLHDLKVPTPIFDNDLIFFLTSNYKKL